MDKFSRTTADQLGHYVYALIDPRTNEIFYVGKGIGNRAFSHLRQELGESRKQERIKEIRDANEEPVVDVLRYGLNEAHALEVEAAVIDALGFENLTNDVRGHGIERGRLSAHEVNRLLGSREIDLAHWDDPVMLIFIKQTYSPTLSEQELYDCTRQFWYRVAKTKRTPDVNGDLPYPVALAVVDSVVVRAYSIAAWFPAGTTMSSRSNDAIQHADRWEFVGNRIEGHPLISRKLIRNGEELPALQRGFGYLN
jgi:hypothetical protein